MNFTNIRRIKTLLLLSIFIISLNGYSQHVAKIKPGDVVFEKYNNNEKKTFKQIEKNQFEYFFINFSSPLNKNEISQLKESVKLITYLPTNTYVVQIKNIQQYEQIKNISGFYGIEAILSKHKIDPDLSHPDIYPEYIKKENGKLDVVISIYDHLSTETFKNFTTENNIKIIEKYGEINSFHVRISENDLHKIAKADIVFYIEPCEAPPVAENLQSTTNHRSNYIGDNGANGLNFNGKGVYVAMNDDGLIGPHIDYHNRADQTSITSDGGDHGDHCAGIIMGGGNKDPRHRGNAWGANLWVYNVYRAFDSIPQTYNNPGVVITSTSYGAACNGNYNAFARRLDVQINDYPNLMHVFSAGNSGTQDCGYGAGDGYGNITGGHKIGKNLICVGNLSKTDVIANSSSRGPTSDGRLKPDITAVGSQVTSTIAPPEHGYGSKSGTSMACPAISGVLAQMYEAYRFHNNGQTPSSDIMKACLLNSADDLGNAGPDFVYGYGRVNARRAYQLIENNQFFTDNIVQSGLNTHSVNVPANTKELKIMLYWNDIAAPANASSPLINDLDLKVIAPNNNDFLPWILDITPNASNLSALATRGIDRINNTEQITINNPAAGNYDIEISGFNIPLGAEQEYVVVYEFVPEELVLTYPTGGESFVPGEFERIRWDSYGLSQGIVLSFSTDGGNSWSNISNLNANSRSFSWGVPNSIGGNILVRVQQGSNVSTSAPINIMNVPNNLKIDTICGANITVEWDAVPNVDYYEVYKLDSLYMEVYDTTSNIYYQFHNLDLTQENWFSVRAIHNNGAIGRRAVSVQLNGNLLNCEDFTDLALQKISFPTENYLSSCFLGSTDSVKIEIKNNGLDTIFQFTASYQINNDSIITDSINLTLAPGEIANYTFQNSEDFSTLIGSSNSITVNVDLIGDMDNSNDAINNQLFFVSNATVINTFPYFEGFEGMNNCSTSSGCEAVICNLTGGWENLTNNDIDDIDWRINSGTTPSANTGPNVDYNIGTNAGKYLYLEATSCFNKEAILVSPCFDLTGTTAPELSFAYHMFGSNMGSLALDIIVDGDYMHNIIPEKTDDLGNNWLQETINLAPYIGQNVVLVFRGITGTNFRSDMAFDAITIVNKPFPPTANFNHSPQNTCAGDTVTLINLSGNNPAGFLWDIQPNTYQFVNNSNAQSFEPQIIFTANGDYDVSLSTFNGNGSDTLILSDHISIGNGQPTQFSEDFENPIFPSNGLTVTPNPHSVNWDRIALTHGPNGSSTHAAYMNHFSYNGAQDYENYLYLPLINLANNFAVNLTFDVAYARYNNNFTDALRVEISNDCGQTYDIVYNKSANTLATAANTTNEFFPNNQNQWRNEIVNLNNYVGDNVIIRFVSVNGFGNNLFLDNINIFETSIIADFNVANFCVGEQAIFTDASNGQNIQTFDWNFGVGNPASISGQGPHQVVFNQTGSFPVSLTVTGPWGSVTRTKNVSIIAPPTANFNFSINGNSVSFSSTSSFANTQTWFFGDGNFTGLNNPTYPYQKDTIYEASLVATNTCGSDTITKIIDLSPPTDTSTNVLSESLENINLYVSPNPSRGIFIVGGNANHLGNALIEVIDFNGKTIVIENFKLAQITSGKTINIEDQANGIYLLRVIHGNKIWSEKIILNK